MPATEPTLWTVGITETCERLGIFSSYENAVSFIGTLPGREDGRYFLDGPCEDIILRDPNDTEPFAGDYNDPGSKWNVEADMLDDHVFTDAEGNER